MPTFHVHTSEAAILSRVLEPDKPSLSFKAASAILALDFNQADKDRMRQLSAKAREGTLTGDEQVEINNYWSLAFFFFCRRANRRKSLFLKTSNQV